MLLKNEKVISIMERTLNRVDSRLIDHGKRVAYLMYKVLHPHNRYNSKQLRDICILGMLHDIGAYKTEEIDKMVEFETIDVWDHSIYGYLFLKHFSPLKELAPVLLCHHADCNEVKRLDDLEHQFIAQLISLCDRADVYSLHEGDNEGFRRHAEENRDIKYRSDVVDIVLASNINIDTVFDDIDSDRGFDSAFRSAPLTSDEASSYIKMIICAIDFRSRYTVIHTIATTCVAGLLAKYMGVSDEEIEKIKTGAMLHDIGKVGISVNILDYPGKLSDEDMAIMRSHVVNTKDILDGNVDDDVKHIAVNHHEKLDGFGYPNRLRDTDVDKYDRIVTVADIFEALNGVRSYKDAYPKEKVVEILQDMAKRNMLDSEIVSIAIEHFDNILEQVKKDAQPIMQAYSDINEEYKMIRLTL